MAATHSGGDAEFQHTWDAGLQVVFPQGKADAGWPHSLTDEIIIHVSPAHPTAAEQFESVAVLQA